MPKLAPNNYMGESKHVYYRQVPFYKPCHVLEDELEPQILHGT